MDSSGAKRFFRDCLYALTEAVIIAFVLYFLLWPVHIQGTSMTETFHPGDRVVMSRVLVFFRCFSRSDVVVCKSSASNGGRDIIKRIIAVPGDWLVISDGIIILNGEELDEPYINDTFTSGNIDIMLGEDEYFIAGDNRQESMDSRHYGAIRRDHIIGRVVFKIYPFNKVGLY